MKNLNYEQREFLHRVKSIGVDKIIDTKEFWELTFVDDASYLNITEKELSILSQKQNTGDIDTYMGTWKKEYMDEWINKWLGSNIYFEKNNDARILNSLGRYYKRYRYKNDKK